MPKIVKRDKKKIARGPGILNAIITFLPIIITLSYFVNGDRAYLTSTYGMFTIFAFVITFYIGIIYGLLSFKHKVAYIVFDVINAIAILALLFASFSLPAKQKLLLSHLCAVLAFSAMVYKLGDTFDNHMFFPRYALGLLTVVDGLLFICMSLKSNSYEFGHISAYLVIFASLILFLVFEVIILKNKRLDVIASNTVDYEEPTDSEIKEAKQREKDKEIQNKLSAPGAEVKNPGSSIYKISNWTIQGLYEEADEFTQKVCDELDDWFEKCYEHALLYPSASTYEEIRDAREVEQSIHDSKNIVENDRKKLYQRIKEISRMTFSSRDNGKYIVINMNSDRVWVDKYSYPLKDGFKVWIKLPFSDSYYYYKKRGYTVDVDFGKYKTNATTLDEVR